MEEGVILEIKDFDTPYTCIPEVESEVIRLKKVEYRRGFYRMEGVMGYEFFHLKKPLLVTNLQVKNHRGWITLMVDDPMHWLGMGELAKLVKSGTVLVGGLGLGLVVHHLITRKDITQVRVIDIDPELISFISPYLPNDTRVEVLNNDYFSYILNCSDKYDSVIIDLWVLNEKSPDSERRWVGESMGVAYNLTKSKLPQAEVLVWGKRGYKF